ncbi:MAG: hypothetical protein IKA36_00395 [Clostridia bacterium]|nr:hypothetical protein [Clostridia bacterium]
MGHTLQDILFDPKDKILKNTSFKEFLSVEENLSKVIGNAEYVTKSLSQALDDFKDIKEFVEFAPYSSISEYLIPNFTTTLLNKGTVNEAMVVKIARVDRVGISNRLYQNKSSIDVSGMLLEAVLQLNEKISVGKLMYHPDNITMVVHKNELIVPNKSVTESQTEIQEAFFGKKKDKKVYSHLNRNEIREAVSLANGVKSTMSPEMKKCIKIGYDSDDMRDYYEGPGNNQMKIGSYDVWKGFENARDDSEYNKFEQGMIEFIKKVNEKFTSSNFPAKCDWDGDWDDGTIEVTSRKEKTE